MLLNISLAQWYQKHESSLRENPTQRPLNGVVANRLLPLLQEHPEEWEALSWLNSGDADPGVSFRTYLARWQESVPEAHKPWVRQVAALFGLKDS